MAERDELTGWGQIAGYLRVSVRAAQTYERKEGLPVRRLPGPKGRVFALAAELDTWKLKSSPESPGVTDAAQFARTVAPEASPPAFDTAIQRRQLLLPALAGSGALLYAAVCGLARSGIFKSRPVDWRVNGNMLTVLGDGSQELWHHVFPAQLHIPAYQRESGQNRCVFTDLDGDGSLETIFIYNPLDSMADRRKVICFSAAGKIRWEFFTNRNVVDSQSREWTPPYFVSNFVVVSPRSGPARVVVTSVHYWSFPNQITVLDAAGKKVGEFWHRGHLTKVAVADLRGDGAPQLILGGVNDAPEYKQATLLAFDPGMIAGASCSPSGDSYFQGFAPGTQKAEVFFPRTLVSHDQEFNRLTAITVTDDRMTVAVAEGINELNNNVVMYDLDFHLNVLSAFLTDPIRSRYRELESEGKIPKGTTQGEDERLRTQVRVLRRSA